VTPPTAAEPTMTANGDASAGDRPLADDGARARIATDLDATLVVEAAAGTGKTTELVNRIVRVPNELIEISLQSVTEGSNKE